MKWLVSRINSLGGMGLASVILSGQRGFVVDPLNASATNIILRGVAKVSTRNAVAVGRWTDIWPSEAKCMLECSVKS